MKNTFLCCFLAASCSFASAQQAEKSPLQEYEELTDTKPIDNAAWEKQKKAVQASWGSTDIRYSKTNVPQLKSSSTWNATAWKGERINGQAVIWSTQALENVSVCVSDLKGSKGNIIPASDIQTNMVRYVMTDELSKDGKTGCGYRPDPTAWDSSIVADVLDIVNTRSMAARTTQPVWVNIWVPQTAAAGNYTGTLSIDAGDAAPLTLQIKLHVTDRTLPAPKDWAFHLDLWQNPFAVARYYQVPLWSEEHFEAMRPAMEKLASAGQKIITTTVMHKPWGGQTYDYFNTMVNRTKKIDGSWSFEYDIFDKWVEYMMSLGINQQINCYSLIPWKLSFQYYDQASDSMKSIDAKPGDTAYNDYWYSFLVSFAKHLKEKGWWEITTIGMDERPVDAMKAAIALIRKADSDYKISLAGLYHPEIEEDLYDLCIAFGHNYPEGIKEKREQQGKKSTYYTCCAEPYPNTFTFSPPAEATWIGWHAAGGNFDGYLRWAYNSWTADPLRDSRFHTWAAGDCYLVYPDGRSSIRMERLIEGIQDFEKIRILREEFTRKNETGKLKKLEAIVSPFQADALATQKASDMVSSARKQLNQF